MQIDDNTTECKAMDEFLKGNNMMGCKIQENFIAELKQSIRDGDDYCSCPGSCVLHGKCVLCVQVHRGHGHHLPHCLQLMVNKKLVHLSELTEHSLIDQIKKPK